MAAFSFRTAMLTSLILLLSATAHANEGEADAEADVQHSWSITISPLHLILPVGEITGEYRLTDEMGIALILGAGNITTQTQTLSGTVEDSFTVYEFGAQFRYYAIGNFIHGLQVGLEALYLTVDREANDGIVASGEGLALGPFVGYKIATNIGFTFDLQAGVQYLAIQAEASSDDDSATGEDSDFIPLLNVNLGWSF